MNNDNPFEGIPFFGDFEKLFGGGQDIGQLQSKSLYK